MLSEANKKLLTQWLLALISNAPGVENPRVFESMYTSNNCVVQFEVTEDGKTNVYFVQFVPFLGSGLNFKDTSMPALEGWSLDANLGFSKSLGGYLTGRFPSASTFEAQNENNSIKPSQVWYGILEEMLRDAVM